MAATPAYVASPHGVFAIHSAIPATMMPTTIKGTSFSPAYSLASPSTAVFTPVLNGAVSVSGITGISAFGTIPSPYTMELVQETAMLEHGSNRMVGKQMAFYQNSSQNNEPKTPRVRRTFKELQRELECPHEGCIRRYASRSSLATHIRLKHSLEAKQQQEDMKMQRKKSLERQATPRPVRPRTHVQQPAMMTPASLDLLRHHSIPTTAALTTSPFVIPAPIATTPITEPTAMLVNPFSATFASPAFAYATPPQYSIDPSTAVTPKSEDALIHRVRSFSLPATTALTRPGSVSLSSTSSPTPSTTSMMDCGTSTDSLAQPFQAGPMDEVLLSQLDLDFNAFELASAMTPSSDKRASVCSTVANTPVGFLEGEDEDDDVDRLRANLTYESIEESTNELAEMQMLLCGVASSSKQ